MTIGDSISCDILMNPYNGIRSVLSGTLGEACSVLQFSCTNGSSLIGNPLLTCLPDGQYDHPVPSCSGMCPANKTLEQLNKTQFLMQKLEPRAVIEPLQCSDQRVLDCMYNKFGMLLFFLYGYNMH